MVICGKYNFFLLFSDNGQEFYPGYQGYNEFFLGQGQDGSIGFLPPSQGTPPLTLDPSMPPPGMFKGDNPGIPVPCSLQNKPRRETTALTLFNILL